MSLTPHQSGVGSCEVQSPDIFMSDIRRNLDGQFLNARDSLQQENMCIFARVRPMLPHELSKGFKECIAAVDEKTIRTVIPVSSSRYKSSRESEEIEDFSFSAAFGPETGQFLFFLKTMLPTLQNFVENGNSLVFSYGITGSGRTYTLQGDSENPGIIPLSLRLYFAAVEKQLIDGIKVKPHMYDDIIALSAAEQKEEYRVKKQLLSLYDDECEIAPGSFRSSNNKTFEMLCDFFSGDFEAEERETTLAPEEMASAQAATVMREVIRNSAESQLGICNVWVSFVEIYNESIFDLLTPVTNERKALKLRECNGNVYIKGAREICVSNGDEALKILKIGRKNLSIASTEMNDQSSRSHCFFTIKVVRVQDANNMSHGKVNRLSFCDLAGSERTAKTQTTGIRLKEAGSINTSLLVLGRCLEQLRMNQMVRDKRMIPFRDSKLTRLFSGFFLGQGKAVMIANASPCDFTYDETSHVLKFSALARKLKVNDLMIFYTDVISTLQSICNNRDSLDSDSEIIQKRDEFIEKLKSWTEKLIKKEQENADIEMKIRREVCNEYSEYSDRLLEEKSIWCEEQIETMREIFEKEVANKEKMYEKIILDYKHQLNETTGSDEDAFDNNHSIMELENSAELSPEKSQNEKIIDKSEESYQFQSSKLKELQRTLESTTAELEKAKKELCESQKLVASLDKENGELKSELKILTEKINEFKEVKKYISAAKDDESKICNLEEKLISNENHFEEQLQEKQNLTSQLKKVAAEKELMESSSSISLSSDDEEEKKKVEVKKSAPKEKASNSDSSSEMLSSDFDIRTLIVKCSSCGRQINQFSNKECKRHRKLGVITCKQCYKYYGSIQFSQDELGFNYCTWCGKGGKLVACDFCPNGFCSACIRRNFGRAEISVTTKEGWKCYCCNKKSLKPKIKFCNLVLEDKKKRKEKKAFNESKEACKRFHREMATLKTIGLNKSKSLRHIVKKMEEVITRHKTDLKNVLISLTKQFDTDSSDSD